MGPPLQLEGRAGPHHTTCGGLDRGFLGGVQGAPLLPEGCCLNPPGAQLSRCPHFILLAGAALWPHLTRPPGAPSWPQGIWLLGA